MRKQLKIITLVAITFLAAMLILGFIFALISGGDGKAGVFSDMLNYVIYIIGYGDMPTGNSILKLLLGVFGIIVLSLFSAYLTVSLFWRVDDVLISKNISIWQKKNGNYMASILVGNKGTAICKVSFSMITYDKYNNIISQTETEYINPLIVRNGIWQVDIPVNDSFMYTTLRQYFKYDIHGQTFAMLQYVDTRTGQETIRVQRHDADLVYFTDAFPIESTGKLRRKDFKAQPVNLAAQKLFVEYICSRSIPIDLDKAIPINENAISILHDKQTATMRKSIDAHIDFNKKDPTGAYSPFAMILLSYTTPYFDWTAFHRENAEFQFQIFGSDTVSAIQLEIKDDRMVKIIDMEIPVTEQMTLHSIPLNKYPAEAMKSIREICFTVFQKQMIKPEGDVFIVGCEIVFPKEK